MSQPNARCFRLMETTPYHPCQSVLYIRSNFFFYFDPFENPVASPSFGFAFFQYLPEMVSAVIISSGKVHVTNWNHFSIFWIDELANLGVWAKNLITLHGKMGFRRFACRIKGIFYGFDKVVNGRATWTILIIKVLKMTPAAMIWRCGAYLPLHAIIHASMLIVNINSTALAI